VAIFSPGHPEKLREYVEKKEAEMKKAKNILESNLSSISSAFNLTVGKPGVRYFEGNDGVEKTLNDSLTSKEIIYTYADIEALIQAKQGFVPVAKNVFWGYETIQLQTMVGTMPVIPSMQMLNTTAYKTLYFLDLSVCEMRVLQDMTYEPLAKTNDSEKFMMKIYETFIIKNIAFCSAITGIATSYA